MKVKFIFLLLSLFAGLYSQPCGNSYRHSTTPEVYTKGNTLEVFRFHEKFDRHSLIDEMQKLSDAVRSSLNLFEDKNDKALTYMRMGEYDDALELLLAIEKENPAEYNIIANLGTLYELRGENEKALKYIRKAVSLDSQSHHGSEWFHIQILNAKLLKKDDNWWKDHHVLNLSSIKKDPETIISDITYQLQERLPFTPKPNTMMASILDQTGDYLDKNLKREQAWIIYKIATEYDKDSSFSLQTKMKTLENHFAKNNTAVPDYSAHFIKTEEIISAGSALLRKAIDLRQKHFERLEKEATERRKTRNLFLIAGAAVVALFFTILFISHKRRK